MRFIINPTGGNSSDNYLELTMGKDNIGVTAFRYVNTGYFGEGETYDKLMDQISMEIPEKILQYKRPEKLSDSYKDLEFKLAGKIYNLPCPLRIFMDDGWRVLNPPFIIKNRTQLYMTKEDRIISVEVDTFLGNTYDRQPQYLENTWVRIVRTLDDDAKYANVDLEIPNGIRLGTPYKDVKTAYNNAQFFEMLDFSLFYFGDRKGYQEESAYQVTTDKKFKGVIKIEIMYNKDELPY